LKRLFLLICIINLFACSNKKPEPTLKTKNKNPFYDIAYDYFLIGKSDSAFKYFDKAKDLFLLQKDSFNTGKCFLQMAIFTTDVGDNYGGIELSLNSLSYLNVKDTTQYAYIHRNYNNLAIASYKLKNYKNALKYYNDAINFTSKPSDKFIYLNNKAKTYEELKNYNQAIKIYSQVLKGSNNHPTEFAMSLANVALTKWKQNPKYNPVPEYLKSLDIRQREKDYLGMSFCYAKLADYYSSIGNTNLALQYSEEMFRVNQKIKSPDDKLEALYKLVKYGPIVKTKYYFGIYEKLDDSLRQKRLATRNEFALVRYESEKSKTENLKLQKDNTEKKYQIIKREILFAITFLLLIAGSIIAVLWYKKRKQRIELEAEKAIQENQLKTSKKVHDVVANGLYTIMTKLDNRDAFKNDPIVDEMEELYEKSRNISYEKTISRDTHFNEKLSNLVKSFASNKTEVLIFGNEGKIWTGLNDKTKYELEYILQELMVNMKKHSQASRVIIKFKQLNNQILISYTDNGKGMKNFSPGNGLTNTETRIKSISGLITFDTKPNQGLKVKISFPI